MNARMKGYLDDLSRNIPFSPQLKRVGGGRVELGTWRLLLVGGHDLERFGMAC